MVGRRRLPCSDVVSLVIGSRRKIVIHWTTNFPFLTTTCTKNPKNSLLKDSHSCPWICWSVLLHFQLHCHKVRVNIHYYFDILSPNCLRIILFFDYDKMHMAGLTGQQMMLTPSWHLIPPLSFVEVCVCSTPASYFSFGLLILTMFYITTIL